MTFVDKIPIEDVIFYQPVLELLSKKEFSKFQSNFLPLKQALLREEQRYLDKRMRNLLDVHLNEKMAQQIESAREVYERCFPRFEQTLARL